jgi:hypothetical protein
MLAVTNKISHPESIEKRILMYERVVRLEHGWDIAPERGVQIDSVANETTIRLYGLK